MSQTSFIAEAAKEYRTGADHPLLFELASAYGDFDQANKRLKALTGIRSFFPDQKTWAEFRQVLASPVEGEETPQEREWGDFQTPPRLVDQVCRCLANLPISPQVIIEPTYGLGNFILGALKYFPTAKLVYGVEIQQKYEWQLKLNLLTQVRQGSRPTTEIELHQDDIFTHQFSPEVLNAVSLLIIGNPPWVTNAELGGLNSRNLPPKRNLKALNGLDAMTGKSNFDLGEAVLLRLLKLFSHRRGTLALLCKNAVIKNMVKALLEQPFRISNMQALEIDAAREFNAAVDASLLVLEMGQPTTFVCKVTTLKRPTDITKSFGWTRHQFVSDIESYETTYELDGVSPFLWRHGLKHDCAKIMELDGQNGAYTNGNNELVDIEPETNYWLLKSSDLRSFESAQARKKVIVTQHFLGEDTAGLKQQFPKLWSYLTKNSEYFARRKSRIYRDKPRFSIFGIGEYSFKPYKVAISGLYKEPCFSLVCPIDNRPVLLDDTCYFLGFDTYIEALFTASLLNSQIVTRFLGSIVFTDAKRPYTKEILMRIDLARVASLVTFETLKQFWQKVGYNPRVSITATDFEEFAQQLGHKGEPQKNLQLGLGI